MFLRGFEIHHLMGGFIYDVHSLATDVEEEIYEAHGSRFMGCVYLNHALCWSSGNFL